jgi:outer membrane protein assembly factor BamB
VTTSVATATSVSPSQSTTNAGPSPVSATVSTTSPATSATAGNTQESADWPTYHRDNLRTGYVPNEIDPKQLTQKWNTKLDGAVYAEPLIVGTHVLVATEGNSLYSLNAQTGAVEWQTNIAPPVPRPALPCGNIDPLGITGTPVYDPATGLLFAVAEVSGPAHLLVGLDVNSGQIKLRRSADLPGMEPRPHQQRAALALSQGMVYIAYGGLFGDCGNYLGRVVAARTDGQGDLLAFQVPTTREGGIWAASGPAIDSSGRLYVAVGNGEETRGDWDHSDSVLRLSPTLKLEDGFAPKEWQQDNARDADLGSLGPVLLSNGYVLIAGKSGTAYSLKANALGGVGGQVQELKLCSAYGGAASVGNQAFLPCTGGVQAVQVGDDGKLTPGWQAKVNGSPVIGGHTVYSVDQSGTLHALDLETGATRATANIGRTSRFATPTISKGVVYVGTLSGVVAVSLNP